VGKYFSNQRCFKEKNYKAKFSTNSVWKKKFDKDNFGKKSIKKTCEETL
jgi:hypothetical protein